LAGRPLDPAFQNGLQRFVAGVGGIEGEVVAEQQAAPLLTAQPRQELGQRGKILAMNFDEGDGALCLGVHGGMHGLDQGTLAGAARSPEQGIVGRQALGESPRVVEQDIAGPIDAAQQVEIDAADLGNSLEPGAVGMPDEGISLVEGGRGGAAGARRSRASAIR